MSLQKRISAPGPLLNHKGHVTCPGYATKPVWRYDRSKIKAPRHRIKEWDYYYILAPDQGYGITLTIADLGIISIGAICWLDFKKRQFTQKDAFTAGSLKSPPLPQSSDAGTSSFKTRAIKLEIHAAPTTRRILFEARNFVTGARTKDIKGELILSNLPGTESMVIANGWKKNPRAFYYNRKINCMPAKGRVTMGSRNHDFHPGSSWAGLDWGRGNWTHRNRWYWSSASGRLKGHPFGWNLGYGFSDRSMATENMVFFKGKAHKLDQVTFLYDPDDYLAPWQITSNDNRLEMGFTPVLDRHSKIDLKLLKSIQHQVFGHFSGKAVLDDGSVLEISDFPGFAEDVLNWW